jgi:ParB-like chromosome segregation protein Spo0J
MKYPCLVIKKLSELLPAPYNPRKISSDALGRLTKSLSELGNLQPITWNAKTGNIVGGHQRLKCYQALQKEEVEVWAVWLDEKQEKAANLALNKLSGEFELPQLKDILEELDTGEIDLDITGFGSEELAELMEQTAPEEKESVDIKSCFEVIAECKNEEEQEKVFNILQAEDIKCRIITL